MYKQGGELARSPHLTEEEADQGVRQLVWGLQSLLEASQDQRLALSWHSPFCEWLCHVVVLRGKADNIKCQAPASHQAPR